MARLTATEASRNFSAVLDRVSAGERIEITRGGTPVAVIEPPAARLVSSAHLREILARAPRPDEEFTHDVRALRSAIGPPREPWPS